MRIMMLLVIAFSLMITIAPTPIDATDCKEPCQAVVTEVKGTCYAHQADKGKKKIAVGDCLLADQELKCGKSAHVKFKFCLTAEEKIVKQSYQIPKVAPLAIKDPKGPIGGRRMGSGPQWQSPSQVGTRPTPSKAQPSCEGQ